MTMSLDALRAFVAVAEAGHFGRAAEHLHMTQPPLSRRIQGLERTIGTPLLRRTAHGADLTPAGQELLRAARSVLAQSEEIPSRVRRVAEGLQGRLRVGFTASAAHTVLGRLLEEADEALPGVEIVLGEHVSTEQLRRLEEATLDVGLMRPTPAAPQLDSRLIHREPMVAAVPADHPLASSCAEVDPALLATQNMITYDPLDAAYFSRLCTAILRGARPRSVQRVAQIHSMLSLVGAGRGVAVVPESAASLPQEGISLLPLAGWEQPVVEMHAVWRRDGDSPVVERALAQLPALREIPISR